MSKKILCTLLSLFVLALSSNLIAAELDTDAWDRYCVSHKDKCMQAARICEQSPKVDCDQVKMAFMQKRPLTKEMVPWRDD